MMICMCTATPLGKRDPEAGSIVVGSTGQVLCELVCSVAGVMYPKGKNQPKPCQEKTSLTMRIKGMRFCALFTEGAGLIGSNSKSFCLTCLARKWLVVVDQHYQ